MAPKYKLTYFDITGFAESIRFIFAYGGIEYEDVRIKKEDWPKHKPNMPFGNIPILEIDGKRVKINQSIALSRFVAKLTNLTGKDDLHNLEIDSMADNICDLRTKIVQYWYEPNEEYKNYLRTSLFNVHLPFLLGKLNAITEENNGYFVRGQLSWVDLFFVSLLNYLDYLVEFDLTENYPGLKNVKNNVLKIPAIKKWIQNRPVGPY